MNKFGQKVKIAREDLGMSQAALGAKIGVSQRSIAAYETGNVRPRGGALRKLALALHLSTDYLLNDEIDDPHSGIEKDPYLEKIYEKYGPSGEVEARALLEKNTALFAGGTLSQEAKDAFFSAVMTAYVTCKEEARQTYSRKTTRKDAAIGKYGYRKIRPE